MFLSQVAARWWSPAPPVADASCADIDSCFTGRASQATNMSSHLLKVPQCDSMHLGTLRIKNG